MWVSNKKESNISLACNYEKLTSNNYKLIKCIKRNTEQTCDNKNKGFC